MTVLGRIAYYRGRRDEVPNQELAKDLAERKDADGIREIAGNLWNENRNVASDCLKVLYEIGYIEPSLIALYTDDFLKLLRSRNNRMVWGGMIGLSDVADIEHNRIWKDIDLVMDTVEKGSVITKVAGFKTLSKVASKGREKEERIFPFLVSMLRDCPPKMIPQYVESISVAVNDRNREELMSVIEGRKEEMIPSQISRLKKALRSFI